MGQGLTANMVLDRAALEDRRLRSGLLRGELAKRARVHPNTITRALGGKGISVKSARQIADALGVKLGSLILKTNVCAGRGNGAGDSVAVRSA